MKKLLRVILIGGLCLITVIALVIAVEDYRWAVAWKQTEADLRKKGEPLTIKECLSPPVPDDQNMAAAPVWKELFDTSDRRNELMTEWHEVEVKFQTSSFMIGKSVDLEKWKSNLPVDSGSINGPAEALLKKFGEYSGLLDQIALAAQRPQTQWRIDYDPLRTLENASFSDTEDFKYMIAIVRVCGLLDLRAVAEVEAGKTQEALNDYLLILRLAEGLRQGHFGWVGHSTSLALEPGAQNIVWDGLCRHAWSREQLVQLQQALVKLDDTQTFVRSLRSNRAMYLEVLAGLLKPPKDDGKFKFRNSLKPEDSQYLLQCIPTCWFDWQRVALVNATQELINSLQTNSFPIVIEILRKLMQKHKHKDDGGLSLKDQLLSPLVASLVDTLKTETVMTAHYSTNSRLAWLACEIEKYRLANGHIPQTLNEIPELKDNPKTIDLMNGQPFHYVLKGDNEYLLYSVGWNQRDDGGIFVGQGRVRGDWVWCSKPGMIEVRDPYSQ